MKQFSSAAIQSLKEALTHIYWRKKDLRAFIYHTIQNKAIVSTIDWENSVKNESIHALVDRMMARLDLYYDDLLRLFDAVMHFDDYSHLSQYSGPKKLDTETGYFKVYNYQHAQTLLADSESQSGARTLERRKAVDANRV